MQMPSITIAAAQTPEFRGDLEGALVHLSETVVHAERVGASLLLLPEAYLQGWLCDDEIARSHALNLHSTEFGQVLERFPSGDLTVVAGILEEAGRLLFNSAIVVRNRSVIAKYRKTFLMPGERPPFTPGTEPTVFELNGARIGIIICNDANYPETTAAVAALGGSIVLCLANNMMRRINAEKWKEEHNRIRSSRCVETGLWLVSADVTGEREGRVAWGPTAVIAPSGQVVAQLPLERANVLFYSVPLG